MTGSTGFVRCNYEALGLRSPELEQFDGRHVVITATIDDEMRGHFGLWPGSVTIRSIAKFKRDPDD